MRSIIQYYKKANTTERLILLSVFALFMPYYIQIASIFIILIYAICTHEFKSLIRANIKQKLILYFTILTFIVSLLNTNYLGVVCSLGFYFIFLYAFYYQRKIHQQLFEVIIDVICYASIISIGYALIQYIIICNNNDISVFAFKVLNQRSNRIRAGFFNANYYAMCIQFVLLCCTYKIIIISHLYKAKIYLGIVLLNMVALYFTGTRSAWIPLVIAVIYMFVANKHWRYTTYAIIVLGGGVLGLLVFPEIFQRINVFKEFDKRMLIWDTAIIGIKAHPIFGEGPLTYMRIYEQYAGHPTQHAHNVYLDPLLSYGISGTLLILSYFYLSGKEAIKNFRNNKNNSVFHLVIGCTLVILIHGITDYTIYWPQCACMFLIIYMGMFQKVEREDKYEL